MGSQKRRSRKLGSIGSETLAMLVSLVRASLLTAPAWAGLSEGVVACALGDYATAIREFRPLAEQGNAHAQYNLSVMYRYARLARTEFRDSDEESTELSGPIDESELTDFKEFIALWGF